MTPVLGQCTKPLAQAGMCCFLQVPPLLPQIYIPEIKGTWATEELWRLRYIQFIFCQPGSIYLGLIIICHTSFWNICFWFTFFLAKTVPQTTNLYQVMINPFNGRVCFPIMHYIQTCYLYFLSPALSFFKSSVICVSF